MKHVSTTIRKSTFLKGLIVLPFAFFVACTHQDKFTVDAVATKSVINAMSRSWLPEYGFVDAVIDFSLSYNVQLSLQYYKSGKMNLGSPGFKKSRAATSNEGLLAPGLIGTFDVQSITICGAEVISSTAVTDNASQLNVTVPPHAPAMCDVVVTSQDGQQLVLNQVVKYVPIPKPVAVVPGGGSINGQTSVKISGTDFPDAPVVNIGDLPCAIQSSSVTEIVCLTSAHSAGLVSVDITDSVHAGLEGVLKDSYLYAVAPAVTGILQTTGPSNGGFSIDITGTDLSPGVSVTINGVPATVVSSSATTVTVVFPDLSALPPASSLAVVVTNSDGQTGSNSIPFALTAPVVLSGTPAPTGTPAPAAVPSISGVVATVSGVNGGALGGSTSVTITGMNLVGPATVDFGGSACNNVVVVSSTQITCNTTSHAPGSVTVTVTDGDGQIATLANAFSYNVAPVGTVLNSSNGSMGSPISISGTGFVSGSTVTVGGVACTGVIVTVPGAITCNAPAHAPGAVSVVVKNPDGQSTTLPTQFNYNALPSISGVVATLSGVNGGALGGSTSVTITGMNLVGPATVDFGGSACNNVVVVSSTQITCNTTSHAPGSVTVTVTDGDGQVATLANAFSYNAAPIVSSVAPPSGLASGGDVISITGDKFMAGATVMVGGSPCNALSYSLPTNITCKTTSGTSGSVSVVVTNLDKQSGILANGYKYNGAPVITSVTGPTLPAVKAGVSGLVFQIVGSGFISNPVSPMVMIGGQLCLVSFVSPAGDSMTCTLSTALASDKSNAAQVSNPDGQLSNFFPAAVASWSAPIVSSVALNSGTTDGGNTVTITGDHFHAGSQVYFGTQVASGVTVLNLTTIQVTVPAYDASKAYMSGDPLTQNLKVVDAIGQSGVLANAYTYQWPSPVLASISPQASGAPGATLTLAGSYFATAPANMVVKFFSPLLAQCGSDIILSNYTVNLTNGFAAPNDSIHCPPGTRATVVAYNPNSGGSNILSFTYTGGSAPTISGFSPSAVSNSSSTPVTITGTGFAPGMQLFVNSAPVPVVFVSSTSATFSSPILALTGNVPVKVVIPATCAFSQIVNLVYLGAAPSGLAFGPSSLTENLASSLTISGANLQSGATVTFTSTGGTVNCSSYNYAGLPASFTCTAPGLAYTGVNYTVTVTNPDGQSAIGAIAVNQAIHWALKSCASMLGERRDFSTTVMDDGKIVVWGGVQDGPSNTKAFLNDGFIFNPADNTCVATASSCACSARASHTAVKIGGGTLVIFGGYTEVAGSPVYLNTGCRFYESSNSFQVLAQGGAPTPRAFHSAAVVHGEMFVAMGQGPAITPQAYSYSLISNTWAPAQNLGTPPTESTYFGSMVSTGNTAILFGGKGVASNAVSGAGYEYNALTGTWASLSASGAPEARMRHTAILESGKMIVYGGTGVSGDLKSGAVYDSASGIWSTMADGGDTRTGHVAVWTGSQMIVWGGYENSTSFTYPTSLGESYNPVTNTWSNLAVNGTPPTAVPVGFAGAVWSGTQMVLMTSPLDYNLASPAKMSAYGYTP